MACRCCTGLEVISERQSGATTTSIETLQSRSRRAHEN
jgi:hypothetical protein